MSDQEIAKFEQPRLPWHPAIEKKFGVSKGEWKVLAEAIYPAAKTADSIVMVLSYCHSRKLDPFKRPVHIVPIWDSKKNGYIETVWPGISELRTTAMRTGNYAGIDEAEFGGKTTVKFTGKIKKKEWVEITKEVTFPEWCRMTVYRMVEGHRVAFVGPKTYWLESYGTMGASNVPNDMWEKRASGQLEKVAEASALRRAFPEELGNEYAAEEMEGVKYQGPENAKDVTPETERPRRSDFNEEAPSGPENGSETPSDSVPMFAFVDQFGETQNDLLSARDWIDNFSSIIETIEIDVAQDALIEHNQETISLFDETLQKEVKEIIDKSSGNPDHKA